MPETLFREACAFPASECAILQLVFRSHAGAAAVAGAAADAVDLVTEPRLARIHFTCKAAIRVPSLIPRSIDSSDVAFNSINDRSRHLATDTWISTMHPAVPTIWKSDRGRATDVSVLVALAGNAN